MRPQVSLGRVRVRVRFCLLCNTCNSVLFAELESHFSIELTVEKGVVHVRSKPNMHVTEPWSAPVQLFPPVTHPQTKPHGADTEPEPAPLGEWSNLDRVKETLTAFYSNSMRRLVTHIPADVSERESWGRVGCGLGVFGGYVIIFRMTLTLIPSHPQAC